MMPASAIKPITILSIERARKVADCALNLRDSSLHVGRYALPSIVVEQFATVYRGITQGGKNRRRQGAAFPGQDGLVRQIPEAFFVLGHCPTIIRGRVGGGHENPLMRNAWYQSAALSQRLGSFDNGPV